MLKIGHQAVLFFKDKFYEASKQVLAIYNSEFDVHYKEDNSPLTQADLIANEILTKAILKVFPYDFIVSEEIKLKRNYQFPNAFWLIDPIDGTREFINKTGDFTLNIGYIEEGFPVWGMVYAPIYQELYYGGKDYGLYYEKNGIIQNVNDESWDGVIALVSRNHTHPKEQHILEFLGVTHKIPMGSSLKICKLAFNQADIYLRLGETSEWDTAAADALLTASGGMILTQHNQKLLYGKPNLNNPSLVAFSRNYLNKNSTVFDNIKQVLLEMMNADGKRF